MQNIVHGRRGRYEERMSYRDRVRDCSVVQVYNLTYSNGYA